MYSTLTEISQKVGSPFYIVHPELFRENLKNFSKAFTDIYPRFILSYSFKTNYTPFLLQIVKEEGFFAEVVSDIEYDLAKLVGFSGAKGVGIAAVCAEAEGLLGASKLDAGEIGTLRFDYGAQVDGTGTLQNLVEDLVTHHVKDFYLHRTAAALGEVQDSFV